MEIRFYQWCVWPINPYVLKRCNMFLDFTCFLFFCPLKIPVKKRVTLVTWSFYNLFLIRNTNVFIQALKAKQSGGSKWLLTVCCVMSHVKLITVLGDCSSKRAWMDTPNSRMCICFCASMWLPRIPRWGEEISGGAHWSLMNLFCSEYVDLCLQYGFYIKLL